MKEKLGAKWTAKEETTEIMSNNKAAGARPLEISVANARARSTSSNNSQYISMYR